MNQKLCMMLHELVDSTGIPSNSARRNREFFRLMDETGLTADQLRSVLEVREALAKVLASVSSAALDVARSAVIAFSPVVSALEAALRADEEEEEQA